MRQPLVYRKRILKVDGSARAGDLVAVYARAKEEDASEDAILLGYGLYNPRAEISVRMLRFSPTLPDEAFWDATLNQAVSLRRDNLGLDRDTDAYRLVHAESDGLPGLVVDRYGDVLSGEAFSFGMYLRGREILHRLAAICGAQHTILRTSPHFGSQEGQERPAWYSESAPQSVVIREFGTRFRVRLDEETHKTGFFCDQRDNRRMLASFCAGKSVLDLCCYSGGFAIQAKKLGGAEEVIGVDLDEHPLAAARENANLNQVRVRFVQADVFPYMRDMIRSGRQFDVVVLDPPKLIRSRQELDEGTRKHYDLNRLAMQLVKPGGILLTCTCAGLLSPEKFMDVVLSAGRNALNSTDADGELVRRSRHLRILAKTGAAADHPIAGNCPETEYLNAIWARIDDLP